MLDVLITTPELLIGTAVYKGPRIYHVFKTSVIYIKNP